MTRQPLARHSGSAAKAPVKTVDRLLNTTSEELEAAAVPICRLQPDD
jgi:hypothetical protein